MTVSHRACVLCLGGGRERPFLGGPSENWTVCCFPWYQPIGHRICSDSERVSVPWLHAWRVKES